MMNDDIKTNRRINVENPLQNILLDENTKAEAEEYLKKRMNWIPRNENEEDLFQMGLQSLLDNYI